MVLSKVTYIAFKANILSVHAFPGNRTHAVWSRCCVADVPDPPENVKCTGVGEDCATIIWEPPKFDGGAPLKGNTHLLEVT